MQFSPKDLVHISYLDLNLLDYDNPIFIFGMNFGN
jgi:hypothetical protein